MSKDNIGSKRELEDLRQERDYYRGLANGWWPELVSTRKERDEWRGRALRAEGKLQEKERLGKAIVEAVALRRQVRSFSNYHTFLDQLRRSAQQGKLL